VPVLVAEKFDFEIKDDTPSLRDIYADDTTPVMDIVGVATIASLKAAVMVTVSDAANILSSSVSVKVTVGEVWADRLKLEIIKNSTQKRILFFDIQ
jgi:hypothetical protein